MSVRTFHYLNLMGLAVSILVACLAPSFRADEECFTRWGERGLSHSLMHIYDTLESTNYTYPPLGVYICAAADEIRDLTGFPSPSVVWRLLLKLPPMIAVFLGAYVVRGISIRLFPRLNANAAGLMFAFNPVLLLVGPVWGQWDALLVLGILCTVWAMVSGKWILAGPAVVTTALIKPQVILAVPVLGIAALVVAGYRKVALSMAAGALVFLCLTAPFFVAGTGGAMLKSFGSPASACGRTTYYAPNLWAIYERLDPHVRQHDFIAAADGSFLGVTSCSLVGVALYTSLMLLILRAVLRQRTWESCILGLFLSIFGAFCLMTGMHERYAVAAVMVLGLIALLRQRHRAAYVILTLTTVLNLGYVYLLSRSEGPAFLAYMRILLAATAPLNIALLAVVLWGFLRTYRSKSAATTDDVWTAYASS